MFHSRATIGRPRWRIPLMMAVMLLLAGCGGQMSEQPRCDPLEASAFFNDGQCSRHLPPNTVARGQLEEDTLLFTGQAAAQDAGQDSPAGEGESGTGEEEPVPEGEAGESESGAAEEPEAPEGETAAQGGPPQFSDEFPFPVTMEVMERGQERYGIYCAPCHSLDGQGDGMIVRRGFPPPPSLHDQRLRDAEPGYLFDVITNGIGVMPPYDGQIQKASDRWAIVAYLRALQLSQNATLEDIPEDERGALESE